ncbi:hypothetical protein MNBD_ALPHA11-2031 [hydrothermal vent metagenome]|uniref:Uncharacterized protein n=1 Tax=hydrothermal vent metagenome TaxID=652676 RepID=A0A3B0T9E2_9ZZZZ
MRIISLILAIFMGLFSFSALAGQNSQFSPIGYSGDGRFFSYEEYRIDEASGDAYSKIYVIDLAEISQVVGTPIIYRANIEQHSISQIREQARQSADAVLQSLEIDQPAYIAAMIGDGQPDVANERLKFAIASAQNIKNQPTLSMGYELSLETFTTEAAAQCDRLVAITPFSSPMGFSLSLKNLPPESAKQQTAIEKEIYRDEVLPRSRDCPFSYAIAAIVLPFGANDIANSVAVIAVNVASEQGVLRHYLAIPLN